MKRSELTVGEAYYHDGSPDWETGTWRGRRVVVLATEPYERISGPGWRTRQIEPSRDGKGNGVLVETADRSGKTAREVVQLAHLRGPYEQVKATVDAAAKTRQNREGAVKDAAIHRRADEEAAAVAAKARGITAWPAYAPHGPGQVRVDVVTFQAMLAALPEDWTFQAVLAVLPEGWRPETEETR